MAKIKKNQKEFQEKFKYTNKKITVPKLVDLIINRASKELLLEWKNFCLTWLYHYNYHVSDLKESLLFSKYVYTDEKEQIVQDTVKLIIKKTNEPLHLESLPYEKILKRVNKLVKFYFGIKKFGVEVQETITLDELLLRINPNLVKINQSIDRMVENKEDLIKNWPNYNQIKPVLDLLGTRLKLREGQKTKVFLYLNINNLIIIEIAKNLMFKLKGATPQDYFRFYESEFKKIEDAKKSYTEKLSALITIIISKKVPLSLYYLPGNSSFILSFGTPYNDLLEIHICFDNITGYKILSSDSEKVLRILKMLAIANTIFSWTPVDTSLVGFKNLFGFALNKEHYKKIDFFYNVIKSAEFTNFLKNNTNADFDKKFDFLCNYSYEKRANQQAFFNNPVTLTQSNNNNNNNSNNNHQNNINKEVISVIKEVTRDGLKLAPDYDTTEAIGFNIVPCQDGYGFKSQNNGV